MLEVGLPEGGCRRTSGYTTLSVWVGVCSEGRRVSPSSDVTLERATYSCP